MERYREIIETWKEFRKSCKTSAVPAVRKNQIKAGKGFEQRLRESFDEVERSEWNPGVYRLKSTDTPGKSMLHWLGEYYVQEESATLPVEVLSPEKEEKILDMCASPGGKTTQIASKIDNEGVVVANDDSAQRMKSLHANIYRTGAACVVATNYDGRHLPGNEYDRILVDAPCSGEGNRARRNFRSAEKDDIEGLAELQKQLMEKAAELIKQDGVIVYSTCTFAPEENEEVVGHTLEETGLELEKIQTDAPHQKGITGFKDREYSSEMKKTVRVYPHHMDSGGIYVARFRK